MKTINFNECPRPQFVRDSWTSLDGEWDFAFDWSQNQIWPNKLGWEKGFEKQYSIKVPFSYESKLSGIGITKRCDSVWYQKKINLKKIEGKRTILHLEGADYDVRVFVNGKYIGCDSGAYHRMSFDLTDGLVDGENLLVINCVDDYALYKPRGKQRWRDESFECFYIDTTGIYKSVWLETISDVSIKRVRINPNLDNKDVNFGIHLTKQIKNYSIKTSIFFENELISSNTVSLDKKYSSIVLPVKEPIHLWGVNEGNLYDVLFELFDEQGKLVDKATSYFGMRKLEVINGKITLNGKPLYQKLILDQGYWLDSLITAPDNKALYDDIIKMQQLGFNGCRKHQKFEDERFMYYADVLGYLVWCEFPSMYVNTPTSRLIAEREWMLEIKQACNHPSIITWTIFNESWGISDIKTNVAEQQFVEKMYALTKEYDPSRFVISNDGWEHTNDDLLTMHDYEQDGDKLFSIFATVDKCLQEVWDGHSKGAYADGFSYHGQPILLTEFGGTSCMETNKDFWSYGSKVKDNNEFIVRLDSLFAAIQKCEHIQGYCYTQVSDVQQEINGLLTEDHKFKVDPSIIKAMQDRKN